METIDLKEPAIDFLEDIVMFERDQVLRSVNVLIRYFQRNDLNSATGSDLLTLEAKCILKMRGISALGYVRLCDKIHEAYPLLKDQYPFFSAYEAMKELLKGRKYVQKNTIRKKLRKKLST